MDGKGFEKLYAALGVKEEAGPEELRRAYLALAVKHHPDRNPGDRAAEERFKEISEAYAILTDPAAKARYARMRSTRNGDDRAASASSSEGRASYQGDEGQTGESTFSRAGSRAAGPDLEEILAAFFKSAKGRDLLKDLAGELKKAGLDFKMDDFADWLKSRRPRADGQRRGFWEGLLAALFGARSSSRRFDQFDIHYGLVISSRDSSRGLRVELLHQNGSGPPKTISVQIPSGIKNGECLRLPALGYFRPDSGRGDLFITVKVAC